MKNQDQTKREGEAARLWRAAHELAEEFRCLGVEPQELYEDLAGRYARRVAKLERQARGDVARTFDTPATRAYYAATDAIRNAHCTLSRQRDARKHLVPQEEAVPLHASIGTVEQTVGHLDTDAAIRRLHGPAREGALLLLLGYTVREAARLMGCDPHTLHRWIENAAV